MGAYVQKRTMTARKKMLGPAFTLTLVVTVMIAACTGDYVTPTSSSLDRELLRIDVPTMRMLGPSWG